MNKTPTGHTLVMLKQIILWLCLITSKVLFAQASFETIYGTDENETLRHSIEIQTGDFISIGGKKGSSTLHQLSNLIIKFNKYGVLVDELIFSKPDTNFILQYCYEKANGNLFFIGTLSDSVSPNEYDVTYVCERTAQLDLLWEKYFPMPEPYFDHRISNFIMDLDSNLIIQGSADSSQAGSDELLITMKIDKYGNQLNLSFYEDWRSMSTANEMIFNSDSTAIWFFGTFTVDVTLYHEFIEMDLDFNITNYISIIDWDHFSSIPITIKKLPNFKLIQANQATMEPGAAYDLYVKIMDANFNTIEDTLLFFTEYMYIPWYNGLDFNNQNQIWVATFEPQFNYFTGTEIFIFHIFDSNLNLVGLKEYGGDQRYTFFNLKVTSDGGCLLTGTIPDYDGSFNDNGYIIKVMPQDIITNAEETPISIDRDVMIYPNPFKNEIRFQTVRKNLTFNLYDLTGNIILTGDIVDNTEFKISTGHLNQGIYFYTIRDDWRIIQSGKLIKD